LTFSFSPDPTQLSGDGTGPGFAPLWPGGDVIRRHRDHRCDCDAAQPLSALGPRTERELQKDAQSIRRAIRFNTIDSAAALTVTFFVNAAILVLAAMVFFGKESVIVSGGQVVSFTASSDWIRVAYLTLSPLLGTAAASTLFAVALLASGQSSTITSTLAGQVVMDRGQEQMTRCGA
jgi:Mn2+/Fe2+ NRAMP family transporter